MTDFYRTRIWPIFWCDLAAVTILPNQIDRNFLGTFGMGEMEFAAKQIVDFCRDNGDSWQHVFRPHDFSDGRSSPDALTGFVHLASNELLRAAHPNSCWVVTPRFVAKLRIKKEPTCSVQEQIP